MNDVMASVCVEVDVNTSDMWMMMMFRLQCVDDDDKASVCVDDDVKTSVCVDDGVEASASVDVVDVGDVDALVCMDDGDEVSVYLDDGGEASVCVNDDIKTLVSVDDKVKTSVPWMIV